MRVLLVAYPSHDFFLPHVLTHACIVLYVYSFKEYILKGSAKLAEQVLYEVIKSACILYLQMISLSCCFVPDNTDSRTGADIHEAEQHQAQCCQEGLIGDFYAHCVDVMVHNCNPAPCSVHGGA